MSKQIYMKEYYKNNKDKWVLDTEEKKTKRKIAVQKYNKKHYAELKIKKHKWIEDNYQSYMYAQAKRRCGRTGMDFSLDIEDCLIPEYCPYLGIRLDVTQGNGRNWAAPSLDRKDNSLGYIKGNTEVISMRANAMKQAASKEELIQFSKTVLNRFSNDEIKLEDIGSFDRSIKRDHG